MRKIFMLGGCVLLLGLIACSKLEPKSQSSEAASEDSSQLAPASQPLAISASEIDLHLKLLHADFLQLEQLAKLERVYFAEFLPKFKAAAQAKHTASLKQQIPGHIQRLQQFKQALTALQLNTAEAKDLRDKMLINNANDQQMAGSMLEPAPSLQRANWIKEKTDKDLFKYRSARTAILHQLDAANPKTITQQPAIAKSNLDIAQAKAQTQSFEQFGEVHGLRQEYIQIALVIKNFRSKATPLEQRLDQATIAKDRAMLDQLIPQYLALLQRYNAELLDLDLVKSETRTMRQLLLEHNRLQDELLANSLHTPPDQQTVAQFTRKRLQLERQYQSINQALKLKFQAVQAKAE